MINNVYQQEAAERNAFNYPANGMRISAYDVGHLNDVDVVYNSVDFTDPADDIKEKVKYADVLTRIATFALHEDASNCGIILMHNLYTGFEARALGSARGKVMMSKIFETIYAYIDECGDEDEYRGVHAFGYAPGELKNCAMIRMTYASDQQHSGSLRGFVQWLLEQYPEQTKLGVCVRNPNSGNMIQDVIFIPSGTRKCKRGAYDIGFHDS